MATRAAVGPSRSVALTPVDVGLLRLAAPALLFAPVWAAPLWRAHGRLAARVGAAMKPPGLSWLRLLALLGWGPPFVISASVGLSEAGVAPFAAMTPGSMPLWACLFGVLAFGDRVTPRRALGLAAAVAASVLALIAAEDAAAALAAAPWLFGAALGWAAYGAAFAGSGLTPIHAAGLVGAWSTAIFGALALFWGWRAPELSTAALLWNLLMQGLLTGAASVALWGVAIARLGAVAAGAMPALVPPLAAILAWALLGEPLGALALLATIVAGLAVALLAGRPRRA